SAAGNEGQQRRADADPETLRYALAEGEDAGRLGHLLGRDVGIGERAHPDHLGRAKDPETEEIAGDQKMRRVDGEEGKPRHQYGVERGAREKHLPKAVTLD